MWSTYFPKAGKLRSGPPDLQPSGWMRNHLLTSQENSCAYSRPKKGHMLQRRAFHAPWTSSGFVYRHVRSMVLLSLAKMKTLCLQGTLDMKICVTKVRWTHVPRQHSAVSVASAVAVRNGPGWMCWNTKQCLRQSLYPAKSFQANSCLPPGRSSKSSSVATALPTWCSAKTAVQATILLNFHFAGGLLGLKDDTPTERLLQVCERNWKSPTVDVQAVGPAPQSWKHLGLVTRLVDSPVWHWPAQRASCWLRLLG